MLKPCLILIEIPIEFRVCHSSVVAACWPCYSGLKLTSNFKKDSSCRPTKTICMNWYLLLTFFFWKSVMYKGMKTGFVCVDAFKGLLAGNCWSLLKSSISPIDTGLPIQGIDIVLTYTSFYRHRPFSNPTTSDIL